MRWDVTQTIKGTNLSPSEVNEARDYYTKKKLISSGKRLRHRHTE